MFQNFGSVVTREKLLRLSWVKNIRQKVLPDIQQNFGHFAELSEQINIKLQYIRKVYFDLNFGCVLYTISMQN